MFPPGKCTIHDEKRKVTEKSIVQKGRKLGNSDEESLPSNGERGRNTESGSVLGERKREKEKGREGGKETKLRERENTH